MPDNEVAGLAKAIEVGLPSGFIETADGGIVPIPEPKPSDSPQPGASAKPQGDGTTQPTGDKQETPATAQPPEGEKQEGEEDPLAKLDLKALLEHPTLGPLLNSWADRAATAQVTSALERERGKMSADAEKQASDKQWDNYFAGLSQEELADALAEKPETAVQYARYQERQVHPTMDPDMLRDGAQLYALSVQVATNKQVLEQSDLPDDIKATLDSSKFTHLGPDGVVAWGNAIWAAMVSHEAAKQVEAALNDRWETFKQEHLAELETGAKPPLTTSGRRAPGIPDLISTPSTSLLEGALERTPPAKP